MAPAQVIERYKSLADIERGFKVLKSELEIGPVYHRLPERIRAHASIRFMALIPSEKLSPRCAPPSSCSPSETVASFSLTCSTPLAKTRQIRMN